MIIMAGVIVAAVIATRLVSNRGKDPELVWEALLWVLFLGLIGARLYHVFTPSKGSGITTSYYFQNPLEILFVWKGGLGWPGAILGGILGLYIFSRRSKLSVLFLLDVTAPVVAIAHAIGRWGNYVNQELYGPPTSVPWCIYIKPINRLPEVMDSACFHPLFLYESLWNLLIGLFLLWLGHGIASAIKPRGFLKKIAKPFQWLERRFASLREKLILGDIFLGYLVLYPFGRFLLEFIRLDYVPLFGINFNQMLMLVVAITSLLVLILRHRLSARKASGVK
jgi:phosphatidylglycerol:prolipoprotein diacylglycerol transferase